MRKELGIVIGRLNEDGKRHLKDIFFAEENEHLEKRADFLSDAGKKYFYIKPPFYKYRKS